MHETTQVATTEAQDRNPIDIEEQHHVTEQLLAHATVPIRAVVDRWRSFAESPRDLYRFSDKGIVYQWRLNNIGADGATGSVYRVRPDSGPIYHWRIALNGRVMRGTPWMRNVGTNERIHEIDNEPALGPWMLSPPIAVVVMGQLPISEMDELMRRTRAFFGADANIVSDDKLAAKFKAPMTFIRSSDGGDAK